MSGSRRPERRFWLQYVHRSAAVTGLVLLATHVIAVISDSYVSISPTVLFWPFGRGSWLTIPDTFADIPPPPGK